MTFTIKQKLIADRYISIYQEKFSSAYHVELCRRCGEDFRREKDNIYTDIKKANNRFNFLCREVAKGNL